MAATEVQPTCQAFAQLRSACGVADTVRGHEAFRAIAEKHPYLQPLVDTLAAACLSEPGHVERTRDILPVPLTVWLPLPLAGLTIADCDLVLGAPKHRLRGH